MKRMTLAAGMLLAATLSIGVFACTNDTPSGPDGGGTQDDTPIGARLLISGVDLTDTLRLTPGTNNRVDVVLYNSSATPLAIESTNTLHLSFSPTSIATSTDVPGHNFSKNVVSSQPQGTRGTVSVLLDKQGTEPAHTFGPYHVLIQ